MLYHPPFLKLSSKLTAPGSSGHTLHSLSSNRGHSLSQHPLSSRRHLVKVFAVPAQARLHSTSGRNQQHSFGSILVLCCWLRFASQLTAGVFSVSLAEASVLCRNALHCLYILLWGCSTYFQTYHGVYTRATLQQTVSVLHVHVLILLFFSRNLNYSSA